jgi:hypothetical protein
MLINRQGIKSGWVFHNCVYFHVMWVIYNNKLTCDSTATSAT